MKGLGTSQLWGCLCTGVPTLPSPSPEAWQVLPGTRSCLHPALPGVNWLLSVFSLRWQLNLASRRSWQWHEGVCRR